MAGRCFPIGPQCSSSSQTLASAISSPSSRRQSHLRRDAGALFIRMERSDLLGAQSLTQFHLHRPRSATTKRACSASLDAFSDEEFSRKIQELALRFQVSNDDHLSVDWESRFVPNFRIHSRMSSSVDGNADSDSDWAWRDEMVLASSIERKANSMELPVSLRMIKRKMQWEEGLGEGGDCSVKKAFSSMVFIIRELQRFTLQMREGACLQGRVQRELHDSFVWLFQRVFSHTPTLMLYVMILLADFTLHSMAAIATDQSHEAALWNSILEEASSLQAMVRDESLHHKAVHRFVSPLTADIASDHYADYFKTELVYQRGLSQDPHNSLLLANYAHFLYLVSHDYDRAEEFFKRAIKVEPADAEALSKYATFLWKARNDTWAAEETFLEAINADPTNTYYAANYAHFLWNTGGEDTCFPLQHDV